MSATGSALPLVFGLLVAVGLIVAAIPLRRARRSLGVAVAALGGLLLGVLGTVAIIPLFLPSTQVIRVDGLTDEDDGFRAIVPHERVSADGDSYVFRYDGGFDALVADLGDDYPDGVVAGESWSTAVDGIVFVVAADEGFGADAYVAQAQIAEVSDGGEADAMRVPFPVHEFGATNLFWGYPVEVGWSVDQWETFYGEAASTVDGLPAFVVPADAGGEVVVSVDGVLATVTQG